MAQDKIVPFVLFLHWLLTKFSFIFACQQRLFSMNYRDVRKTMTPMLPAPGVRVLDVGCGTAHCAEVLFGKDNYKYTGTDNNPAYIKSNKKRWKQANFVLAERIEEENFADNSYDCALVSSLLHHLNDDQSEDLIKQLKRVLVDGGVILVTDPLFWHRPAKGLSNKISNLMLDWDRGRYIRTADGYKKFFEGLELEQETEYVYTMNRFWAAKFINNSS